MNSVRADTTWAIGLALLAAAAASIAAAFAPLGWPFELFAHFRWQLAATTIALLVAALAVRRPRLIALALATLAVQCVPVLQGRAPALAQTAGTACTAEPLRIVTANVLFTNTEPATLLEWLEHSDADVIALQEVTPGWARALQPLAGKYPYQKVLARADPYGIALLSRWPVQDIQAADLAGDGMPSLVARINVRGRTLQLIALHTRWPVIPSLQVLRDRALQGAAARAATQPESTVLVGDLNLTPYAPAFRRLLDASGLRDAQDDTTWRPTWQASFWPLALPLDHVLVPRDACVTAHSIGPDVGSDHRPVHVTLRLH